MFKRMGFLLQWNTPDDLSVIEKCSQLLTKRNARTAPKLTAERLVSCWWLWLPENWLKAVRT